ncbi:MAG: YdcH family protein [Proteobacteria bacterium]|nr:YdcH family protein [Pseudomonadota bacterium]
MIMNDIEALKNKLAELRTEHRDLDDMIARMTGDESYNQLQIQRLKRRKLALKDQIALIKNRLLPDIIA